MKTYKRKKNYAKWAGLNSDEYEFMKKLLQHYHEIWSNEDKRQKQINSVAGAKSEEVKE